MRAKINEDGCLFLERAGTMKKQNCPYSGFSRCGDWCPLFNTEENLENGWFSIKLCHGREYICRDADFVDGRKINNLIDK